MGFGNSMNSFVNIPNHGHDNEHRAQAGDSIPSMRAQAKSILVSAITVQKAYEDLQRDGLAEKNIDTAKAGTICACFRI